MEASNSMGLGESVRSGFHHFVVGVVVSLGTCLCVASAHANFFSNPMLPTGESASMQGGAATAWINDGSSCWYNPAGLGRANQQGISASLSVYGAQRISVPRYADFGPGITGGIRSTATAVFPSYLGYVLPIVTSGESRQSIGLAVLIPDYERWDGIFTLDLSDQSAPNNAGAFDYKSRFKSIEETFWVTPSWGGCWQQGQLCFGTGLAIAYRSETSTEISDSRGTTMNPAELASVIQRDAWAGSIGALAGFQWQLSEIARVGVSVRTPVRSILGGGTILEIDSDAAMPSPIRRIEDQHLTINYRLPLLARAGASFQFERWRLAMDFSFSPAQPRFPFVRGVGGETAIQPVTANHEPLGDVISIGEDLERRAVIDLAVGASFRATDRWRLVAGLFTNRSGAPAHVNDWLGNRYGITLGTSRKGTKSVTHFGLTTVVGSGNVQGLDASGGTTTVSTTSLAIYANIGATADF